MWIERHNLILGVLILLAGFMVGFEVRSWRVTSSGVFEPEEKMAAPRQPPRAAGPLSRSWSVTVELPDI